MGLMQHTNGFEKDAQFVEHVTQFISPFKAALALSALLGVPLGIGLHYMDRSTSARRRQELEMRERLKYYRNVIDNMETSMADATSPKTVISGA